MPKSKRQKLVSLTRTDSKGFETKEALVSDVQQCIDEYAFVYIFSVQNMRNAKLKEVRTHWRRSRFFFGKNKVMARAFGRDAAEEYRPGLSKIAEALTGNVGVFFTNQSQQTVTEWFAQYGEADYARSGNLATDTVVIPEGPKPEFSHTMEPQLRKLGLPTVLKRGIVTLERAYTVCKKGEALTPEQARVLKLFGHQQATFQLTLQAVWHDSTYAEL